MKTASCKLLLYSGVLIACLVALPGTLLSQRYIRDLSFNKNQPTTNSQSRCIEVITAGPHKNKIMVAGLFTTYSNTWWPTNYPRIVRLLPNGTLDPTFQAGGLPDNVDIYAMAVQPDGKVVVGGVFAIPFGSKTPQDTLHNIARLNADGTLDISFNPNGGGFLGDNRSDDNVRDVLLNTGPDGKLKIWVGGLGEIYNGERIVSGAPGVYRGGLVILNSEDGSIYAKPMVANSPGTSGGGVFAMSLRQDGRVLIGGEFGAIGEVGSPGYIYCRRVASLLSDGRRDPLFKQVADIHGGPGNTVYTVAEQVLPDNSTKIIIGGPFTTFRDNLEGAGSVINYTNLRYIARLNEDGSVDNSFVENTTPGFNVGAIYKIVSDDKGQLIIGGAFRFYNGQTVNRLVRLLPNGEWDASFDIGAGITPVSGGYVAAPFIQDIALQPTAIGTHILISGFYENFDGVAQQGYTIRLADATVLPDVISGFAVTNLHTKAQIVFTGLLPQGTYTIERSTDGRTFAPVTVFTAAGTAVTYSYDDVLDGEAGVFYYRVAVRPPNSTKVEYSSVKRITPERQMAVTLQRVAKNLVLVTSTMKKGVKEQLCVRIVSLGGQLLYEEKWTATQNTTRKKIYLPDQLRNGLLVVSADASAAPLQTLLIK